MVHFANRYIERVAPWRLYQGKAKEVEALLINYWMLLDY
jgi:methionyl-tRNA synthetase